MEAQAFAMSVRKAGAVTTTWLTAIILRGKRQAGCRASLWRPARRDRAGRSCGKQRRYRRRVRVEEREARGRSCAPHKTLARRRRRQTIAASSRWPSSFWRLAALQRGCSESWRLHAEPRSRSLSTRTASCHDCSARSTGSVSIAPKVSPARQETVAQSVRKILSNRARYERITKSMTMPWYFLAIIHGLEADFRFDSHLHNGDPLTGRTVRVPAGRPAQGARRRSVGKKVR